MTAESLTAATPSGNDPLVRSIYVRALGGIHGIAFLSLWVQIHGLVGEQGILPVNSYLRRAGEQLGRETYWRLPTLCWLNAGDGMLTALCAAGTLFAVLLVCGVAPRVVLLGLWIAYLSLCVAGQNFLSFQWDTLLLETTLCSIPYAPRGLWTGRDPSPPLPFARWLLWLLAFKLMFLSGVTKLLSGDETWLHGTALDYHYYTQPIPSWVSWYVHHQPALFHKVSLWAMFVVEVALPFLVFVGRRGRVVFAVSTIVFMAIIEATGNFGFFNLLTAVVCVPLLNDDWLRRWWPGRWPSSALHGPPLVRPRWRTWLENACCSALLFVSLLATVREMERTPPPGKMPSVVSGTLSVLDRLLLSWGEPLVLNPISSFRTINGYGLFRVMTTRRPEIVIEYSRDGLTWAEYEFCYKPGGIDRAPPIVAPYMPRLDWQMWFAALNPRGNAGWMSSLASCILDGNPQTARLMGVPEIARDPPQYVQFAYYEYKFSAPDEQRRSGNWWVRTRLGELTGPLSKRK